MPFEELKTSTSYAYLCGISSFVELTSSLLFLEDSDEKLSDCLPLSGSSTFPDLDDFFSLVPSVRLEESSCLRDGDLSDLPDLDLDDLDPVLFLDFDGVVDQSTVEVAKAGTRVSTDSMT